MTNAQFIRFSKIRKDFKQKVQEWTNCLPQLIEAQKQLAVLCNEANYNVETSIVYNKALDDITSNSIIKWIIVADNPGKKEQEALKNRYLIGKSGQMAEKFFNENMNCDFRSQTIIINKTPIHTPKTAQLKKLIKIFPESKTIMEDSQRFMAKMALDLSILLEADIWVMGLSEIKENGLFESWQKELSSLITNKESIFAFNHFSMGSFSKELKKRRLPNENIEEAVLRIGSENRERILCDSLNT